MRARVSWVVAFVALGLAAACSKDASSATSITPGFTFLLTASAGTGQTAAAGHPVAISPKVVATTNGQLTAAAVVTFTVISGGGSVTGASAKTDGTGTATVGSWTLGATPGVNTLAATSIGAPTVLFTATGVTGPAATMTKSAGDGQSAPVGSSLTLKPAVLVADAVGNPVAGVSITFAIGAGGGAITGATSLTGSNGVATVGGWTLGSIAGANTLTATASGTGINLTAVTFTATGVAGPGASRAKAAGRD